MNTPNLTGAIAAVDEALLSVIDAKRAHEAPHAALDFCLLSLRDVRGVLVHHERDDRP